MKLFVSIFAFLLVVSIHARAEDTTHNELADESSLENFPAQFNRVQEVCKNPGKKSCRPKRVATTKLSCLIPDPRCQTFIDKNCKLAPMGQFVRKLFQQDYTPHSREGEPRDKTRKMGFFIKHPPSDIKKFCKHYDRFSQNLREEFWVYVLMQMTYDESSCNDEEFTATNPKTAGAFQLEPISDARDELRPSICSTKNFKKVYGEKATIRDFKVNTHCALAMLAVQLAPKKSKYAESSAGLQTLSKGSLFSDGSYWEKLRQPHGRVAQKIKKFSACGNP